MFERKNQNVLSEHYSKLIDHSADQDGEASDDDFITLKRADHDLPSDSDLPESSHLSKRKLKMGTSRHAMLKFKPQPTKTLFDEDGRAHGVYEMKDVTEVFKGGEHEVREAEKKFAQEERARLAEADVQDRAVARDRKREKKRKRKDREHAVSIFWLPSAARLTELRET